MASFTHFSLTLSLLLAVVLTRHRVKSDDGEDNLLQGINKYRTSLNLTTLSNNENAACLAKQIAEQYKGRPCTNTTGSNTVPGTEDQFPNYPEYLSHCHLNLTDTKDGEVMPACVPKLDPSLVLTNFTQSLYSGYLNKTMFTGIGISSAGDWIVVVLSSDSSGGSFMDATSAGYSFRLSYLYYLVAFFGSFFL
ncbi:hypothetical protein RND81_12G070600 [Saponaria officinalis]|uniref:Uncharacterized GPI-anchored protein At5g19230-like domain-containing protein n=1 Tax=Saponaria officinalis TaxID=3572 RepID=A0AAW1H7J2_SAPOF